MLNKVSTKGLYAGSAVLPPVVVVTHVTYVMILGAEPEQLVLVAQW